MKKYNLTLAASALTQMIVPDGRGKVLHVTISHTQDQPQTVTFYDREGVQVTQYQVHAMRSPWSITFSNRDAFSFENGLQVNTGNCTCNVVMVY